MGGMGKPPPTLDLRNWMFYTSTSQQVVSSGFSIGNCYQKPPVGGSRYVFGLLCVSTERECLAYSILGFASGASEKKKKKTK